MPSTSSDTPGRVLRPRKAKAPVVAPVKSRNAKKIDTEKIDKLECHSLASGGLHTPWKAFRSLRDEAEDRMIYWGFSPTSGEPSIYILNCSSLESVDITDQLQHISDSNELVKRPLPNLKDPCVALAKPEPGETFLMIFGGEIQGYGKGNSTLYFVDIERRRWGEVQLELNCTNPKPRVAATATLIGNSRLYIFGGTILGKATKSYSLGHISLNRETARLNCAWTFIDKPYPAEIPNSGYFGGFALLDGGKYILLLPGATTPDRNVKFSKVEALTLYDTEDDHFARISSGELQELPTTCWYHAMPPPATLVKDLPHFEVDSPLPLPTSFLISNSALPTSTRNSHIAHLWAVCVCTASDTVTVKVKGIDVEKEIRRIYGREEVEFFAFFTTSEKLCFLGNSNGEEPVDGSAYMAEIKL